ncbi:MAG TPA: hypothetical protein VFX85_04445 [Solirubrobacterales bacterium]|nr:hypothetical protein [Solirubrobacterales bacterium]
MQAVPALPISGVVIDVVSSAAGMAAVVTGLTATGLRALAVLGKSPQEQIEWLTSVGFASGIAISLLLFVFDLVVG